MGTEENLPGFSSAPDSNGNPKNDKEKKGKKKGGGFQSMGLSREVLKGILKRGYKVPTPIQRKVGIFTNQVKIDI
jgi:ATP-dependent RNA helicase DDX54/DBP10